MPSLAEIKQKRLKKFIKKPYRIWDLTGEKNSPNKNIGVAAFSQESSSFLDNEDIKIGINNQITKRQQTDNKETTDRQQRDNRQTTKRQQTDNKETTFRQQRDNNQTTTQTTMRQHLETSLLPTENELVSSIKSLSGLQEKFFYLILEYCNLNNDLQTSQLKTAKISSFIGCTYRCTKITIERIVKKNLVKRLKGKGSIAGYVQFEVLKEIKIIGNRLELQKRNSDNDFKKFIFETRQQIRQQLDNDSDNNDHSSGSYNIYKTTTEDAQNPNQIQTQVPTEWQNIDIEPLSKIGFSIAHLLQIVAQNKLTPQAMQDSINAFAFDLQENNKAKKINSDPINFFMGILRKKGEPYAPPSNYESPQDKAMRIYLERMREIEQGRVAAEKEAINLAYNDWFAQLADVQKKEFLPVSLRQNARLEKNKILEGSARNYFETEVWPDKKQEIIGKTNTVKKEDNEDKVANNNFT